jgi:hypothetical protein
MWVSLSWASCASSIPRILSTDLLPAQHTVKYGQVSCVCVCVCVWCVKSQCRSTIPVEKYFLPCGQVQIYICIFVYIHIYIHIYIYGTRAEVKISCYIYISCICVCYERMLKILRKNTKRYPVIHIYILYVCIHIHVYIYSLLPPLTHLVLL